MSKKGMKWSMSGVTLMELLTVMVIVGILAGIAIPSYRNYLIRAQRSDATAALLRLAAAQEKFYLQNNRYASAAEVALPRPAGLGITGTEHGYYALVVASNNAASDFTATATAVAGGAQATDSDCATFTINEQGQRTALNSSNAVNTERCWR
jgi:type IV pilus assembly protein PilE